VTLAEGENSVFHEGGTSLMIHASPDDYKTDPAETPAPGSPCGVITR